MKKVYILATPKAWIKEWFKDGTWTKENMTSVLIRKENGKLIQVFGSHGDYDYLRNQIIHLISDASCRSIGYGEMIDYSNEFVKGAATYVFK